MTLIRGLADRGITVILVEHHVDMIMAVSDHVTVLDYGEVIADGTAAEVQENHGDRGLFRLRPRRARRQRGADVTRRRRMTAPLLSIDDLRVSYGRIEAVRRVDSRSAG